MQVNPSIFRAYDIRGIYPTELNEEAGYALGRAFVTFLQVDTVIVGRDMRLSGPQIFDAVTHGIMDQVANVINIGMVGTDQYYYACATLGKAGIMVTTSHNLIQYNRCEIILKILQLLKNRSTHYWQRIVNNDPYDGSRNRLFAINNWEYFVFGALTPLLDQHLLGKFSESTADINFFVFALTLLLIILITALCLVIIITKLEPKLERPVWIIGSSLVNDMTPYTTKITPTNYPNLDYLRTLENNIRRLQKLQEKKAVLGIAADPSIDTEIEDIEGELNQLQTFLMINFPRVTRTVDKDQNINC